MPEKEFTENGNINETDLNKPGADEEVEELREIEDIVEEEKDEMKVLKDQLEAKEIEAKKNYELYLRALAELDNVKKRTAREREEYIKYASLPLIKKFLTIVDDLERALQASASTQDYEALSKGLEMIVKKMYEIMQGEGVEPIDAIGKPFDPEYHQPLAVEESSEYPADTVIAEMQKGYVMYGKVIRPSLVKVSN